MCDGLIFEESKWWGILFLRLQVVGNENVRLWSLWTPTASLYKLSSIVSRRVNKQIELWYN